MITESLFEKSFDTVLHQVNGGNVHHRLSRFRRAFIVQSQSAKPTEPRKGARHNPSQWDNHKARLPKGWGNFQRFDIFILLLEVLSTLPQRTLRLQLLWQSE